MSNIQAGTSDIEDVDLSVMKMKHLLRQIKRDEEITETVQTELNACLKRIDGAASEPSNAGPIISTGAVTMLLELAEHALKSLATEASAAGRELTPQLLTVIGRVCQHVDANVKDQVGAQGCNALTLRCIRDHAEEKEIRGSASWVIRFLCEKCDVNGKWFVAAGAVPIILKVLTEYPEAVLAPGGEGQAWPLSVALGSLVKCDPKGRSEAMDCDAITVLLRLASKQTENEALSDIATPLANWDEKEIEARWIEMRQQMENSGSAADAMTMATKNVQIVIAAAKLQSSSFIDLLKTKFCPFQACRNPEVH